MNDITWEPRFARLPDDLAQLVWFREEYVGYLKMLDVTDTPEVKTAEALRLALIEAQPQIEDLLSAIEELRGPLPEFRWPDDDESADGSHLNYARARIQNSVRLLRADAVRLWEDQNDREAWRRLLGAMQLARFLLNQPDDQHQILGSGVYFTLVYTTEGMCKARPPAGRTPEANEFLALVLELRASLRHNGPELERAISLVKSALTE